MSDNLIAYCQEDIRPLITVRKGEVRIGERISLLENIQALDNLSRFKKKGVKFALLGIPEGIGPRANRGRGGTEHAWQAFLKSFLNIQNNRFLGGKETLLLGHVNTAPLQAEAENLDASSDYFYTKLHMLCASLDEMVAPIIEKVVRAGLTPIVIGGGHNNAYPIIKGTSQALQAPIHVINMDAHADFRSLEGRHSGNGFTYAKDQGFLNKYFVMGLHQSYNNEHMLMTLDNTPGIKYQCMEDIIYLDISLMEALKFVTEDSVPFGIELDMDAIAYMPSSAISPSGFTIEQARSYIKKCVQSSKPAYLHLPEAAPTEELEKQILVGKSLSYLVTDFIKMYLGMKH